MSINDFIEKIKSRVGEDEIRDGITVFIVGIVGISSFFLGIWFEKDVENNQVETKQHLIVASELDIETKVPETGDNTTYPFVASKNGTKYYPQGCSGIDRIKPENIIGFADEDKAIASGRQKATGCK